MGRDLTQENVFRLLLTFALPCMAANFLTSLYTLADLSIIGLFTDSVGVSAVSNAGNIVLLQSAVSIALGAGGGILIAQLVGAGKTEALCETIGTMTSLCVVVALVLMVFGIMFAEPLIRLLNTPEEAVAQASAYLRIVCLGLPFYFLWNAFSEILRGMGDSLTPLLILLVSSVINTILDLLFVAVFNWGPDRTWARAKPDRAGKTVWAGWAINFGFFLILGTAALTIPEMIFGIFSNDPEVIAMSRGYMRIAVRMYLAFALMAPPIGLITGVGATALNMVIALLDGVAARIGLSLLFGITLGMGLEGFWRGNALACYISVILPSIYFFSGRWKNRRLLKDG